MHCSQGLPTQPGTKQSSSPSRDHSSSGSIHREGSDSGRSSSGCSRSSMPDPCNGSAVGFVQGQGGMLVKLLVQHEDYKCSLGKPLVAGELV